MLQIILETHDAWKAMVNGTADAGELSNQCVTVPEAVNKLSVADAQSIIDANPAPGPAAVKDTKSKIIII